MVTKAQIKKIHTLKNILGLDDELYREMLSKFDISSSKDLSISDACTFIDILEVQAIGINKWQKPKEKFDELSDRADMATPAQLRKIEAMWIDFLKMSYGKEVKGNTARKSLRKLLRRLYHISDLRFLERDKVSKVLKTIQSMINQKLIAN
ncbi:MAG: regulatory protein GemA [Candidatus Gastranaerophilales bacterium]|nr:regulatory protein GemA [Candidatus Gastranaerophilales bacterium]